MMTSLFDTHWKNNIAAVFAVSLLGPGCSLFSSSPRSLTDDHFRIAWVQDQGKGRDTMARGSTLRLMGYDSRAIFKTRPILKKERNYFKPLITPNGQQVVFSDITKNKVYIVNWSGKNKRSISSGVAVEVWEDPKTDRVWVYIFDGPQIGGGKYTKNDIFRFPLDHPDQRELVWNQSDLTWDNFQLSKDGTKAGGLFPWPKAGVLDFKSGKLQKFGRGCWTSFSPDNQYLLWAFDGPHRNVTIFHPDRKHTRKVNINQAPDIGGYEVYHPRWSNQTRYLTMTGPYKEGEGDNRIRSGGDEVEIYAGRFSPDLKKVEHWIKITDNEKGDFCPDLWLASDSRANTEPVRFQPETSEPETKGQSRLIAEATCVETYSLPDPRNIGMYSRALAVHRYEVTEVVEGSAPGKTIYVAQWLIKNRKLVKPGIEVGKSYRLDLDDFYNYPDLEGERLLMGPTVDPEADIYIDVSQIKP